MINNDFLDKNGNVIREFDILKIFHFIGARRKKWYMYKWVRFNNKGELGFMHLSNKDENVVPLKIFYQKSNIWEIAEIIQSNYR